MFATTEPPRRMCRLGDGVRARNDAMLGMCWCVGFHFNELTMKMKIDSRPLAIYSEQVLCWCSWMNATTWVFRKSFLMLDSRARTTVSLWREVCRMGSQSNLSGAIQPAFKQNSHSIDNLVLSPIDTTQRDCISQGRGWWRPWQIKHIRIIYCLQKKF